MGNKIVSGTPYDHDKSPSPFSAVEELLMNKSISEACLHSWESILPSSNQEKIQLISALRNQRDSGFYTSSPLERVKQQDDTSSVRPRAKSDVQHSCTKPQRPVKPWISNKQRYIIEQCLENAPNELIVNNILKKMTRTNWKFQSFWEFGQLPKEIKANIAQIFANYLSQVVENDKEDLKLSSISEEFGTKLAKYHNLGFKADFLTTAADAMTHECADLDTKAHLHSTAFKAWAKVINKLFSSVRGIFRDGYFKEIRRQRRCSSQNLIDTDIPSSQNFQSSQFYGSFHKLADYCTADQSSASALLATRKISRSHPNLNLLSLPDEFC